VFHPWPFNATAGNKRLTIGRGYTRMKHGF
jgi:hypothetical protein